MSAKWIELDSHDNIYIRVFKVSHFESQRFQTERCIVTMYILV